jgi:hypothetical protein
MAKAFWDGFGGALLNHLEEFKEQIIDAMMIGMTFKQFSEGLVPDRRDAVMMMDGLEMD